MNTYIASLHFKQRISMYGTRIFILLLLTVPNVRCYINFTTYDSENDLLNCVSHLIKRLFINDNTLYFIFDNDSNIWIPTNVDNPRILANINKPIQMNWRSYDRYVIVVDGSLNEMLNKLQNSSIWNENGARGKFLIVTASTNNLTSLFEILWDADIINVILIVYNSLPNVSSQLYMSHPFNDESKCGTIPWPIFIEHCESNMLINFYPIRQLPGCTLIFTNHFNLSKSLKVAPMTGVLGNLLYMLADVLNASLSCLVTPNIYDALYKYSKKIAFTTIYTRVEELVASYDISGCVCEDKGVWVVPKAQRISNVKLIASVFTGNLIAAIAVTMIISSVIWWRLIIYSDGDNMMIHHNFIHNFLMILLFTIGSSSNFIPKSNFLRCFALVYLFYSIIIITLFSANLIGNLTQPGYEHGITTIEELAKSELSVLVPFQISNIKYYFNEKAYTILLDNFVVRPLNMSNYLQDAALYRNASCVVGERALKLFPRESSLVDTIHDSDLLSYQVSVAMRKGHYFMKLFNTISQKLIESGFREKILLDATYQAWFIEEENFKIVLKIEHLKGAFILLGGGLLLGTGTFLIELLISILYWIIMCYFIY